MQRTFPEPEVAAAACAAVARWKRVESGGYGRVNAHWRVELADGRSVFVKQALTDDAVAWLRTERRVLEAIRGDFAPALVGAHDVGECAFLVLEDLTNAFWPPPWSARRIDAVLAALEALHATSPPDGLPRLADLRDDLTGWRAVAADPEPLLGTGLCTRAWLGAALPRLLKAAAEVDLAGEDLLHLDVRSDNLCFVGERVVLVDWNLACIGNGQFDVAFWLPSLHLEGGPLPWEVLPGARELAAAVAGFFAARAGLPPPRGAPTVREFQRRQLEVALPWAARALGLPPSH